LRTQLALGERNASNRDRGSRQSRVSVDVETMLFHGDPHTEPALRTDTGGVIIYVQYPGPNTGKAPIYDGRFNLEARRPVEEERTDV